MRFQRAAAQIAGKVPAMTDEVPEGSGTHSKQSSGGFRYKNLQDLPSCWGQHMGLFK